MNAPDPVAMQSIAPALEIARSLQAPLETAESVFPLVASDEPPALPWQTVFEHAPVALCLTDGESIVAANRACAMLWKADSPGALRAFTLMELLRPALEGALQRLLAAPPGDEVRVTRGRITRLDGEAREVEISISTLPTTAGCDEDPGRPLAQLKFADITQRSLERQQLERSRRELRRLSANLVQAREEERQHIARELHDELGQQLTALKLGLTHLAPQQRSGRDERMASLLGRLDEAFASLRRLATDLRPPILDDLGLNAAIDWLAHETAERLNILITRQLCKNEPASTEAAAIAVYRMVQEALTNVARHAHATRVRIETHCDHAVFLLTVEDNGVGVTEQSVGREGSHGLMGIRERALMLGGQMEIGAGECGGCRITVKLPMGLPGAALEASAPSAGGERVEADAATGDHPPRGAPAAASRSRPARAPLPAWPAQPQRSAEALMHELHVHQVELEMQNEELRRAQVELAATRDRFMNLYDYAPVGYLTLDRDGQVIEANLTGTQLLGERRNGLIRRRLARYVAADDSDRWHRHLRHALEEDGPQRIELEMQPRGGVPFQAQIDSLRVVPVGAEATLRITLTDITVHRQAEMDRRIATTAVEARETERRRVARALHEELGQELSALKMDLASLPGAPAGGERERRMSDILGVLDGAVATVRRIASDLRPLLLDDLGLTAAIDWLARDTAQRLGVRITLALQESQPPLGETTSVAVYRMAQEALIQMARGSAGRDLHLSLHHTPGELMLCLQDDSRGQGALCAGPGMDLGSMRQQVHLLRGRLEVENWLGVRRRIVVHLPMLRSGDQAMPRALSHPPKKELR